MKQKFIYVLIAAFVCILAFFIFAKPAKKLDTRITFDKKDKIPFGTFVAYDLLQKLYPHTNISVNKQAPTKWEKFSGEDSTGKVLFIVNSYFNPSEDELDKITAFAQKGNQVFISALQMNDLTCKYFGVEENSYYDYEYGLSGNTESYRTFDSLNINLDSTVFAGNNHYSYPETGYDNYFYKKDSTYAYSLGYAASGRSNFLAIHSIK